MVPSPVTVQKRAGAVSGKRIMENCEDVSRKKNGTKPSFMIDDILGNDRDSNEELPKSSLTSLDSEACNNSKTEPFLTYPPIKIQQPTPLLLSPLCTSFSQFGLVSPIVHRNYGHNVFSFSSTSDIVSSEEEKYGFHRNENLLPSTAFQPASFFVSSSAQSLIQAPGIPSSHSAGRPLMWKHILHRNNNKRKGGQIRFSTDQTAKLENTFRDQKYLSPTERKRLASFLSLTERQVKTWFQNRRAKWRRLKQETPSMVVES